MKRDRIWAGMFAATLATAALTSIGGQGTAAQSGPERSYLVLLDRGAKVDAVVAGLTAQGAEVTDVNRQVGLLSVTSTDATFRSTGSALAGVEAVAANRSIGSVPTRRPEVVERENLKAARAGRVARSGAVARPKGGDPLDTYLWGMRMIGADRAHATTLGRKAVRVGIMDTGVQGDHPDLAPNFDWSLSRNFTTDMPDIDGPCEHPSCVDPVGEDDDGHGTHVAGTIGAAMNGLGVSGVAPKVDLVEVRAGQDSGYFFLSPVVNALTYSGDAGIDVVNMSFYVDPWLYNCKGGAPEDSAAGSADQDLIIEAMTRALGYAHRKGVTLVAALGNNHEDIAKPRTDFSSPDFGAPAYARTIDNATCFDLPVEGPHVIGTSSLGPSGTKADYSNYTTDLASGEIEVSAPGGWFRDGFGTPTYRSNGNLILSTFPLASLQATGEVDADGNITPLGETTGVLKQCSAAPEDGTAPCGYYAYLQGTSMASPHAAGVAALAISAHGNRHGHGTKGGFGMNPNAVAALLRSTAIDHACPAGGTQEYLREGRSAEYTAACVGTSGFNGIYGAGVVNAAGVVAR